jgi:hypothetical protein
MRRLLFCLTVLALLGFLTGTAAAVPPVRSVQLENSYSAYIDDPACGAPFVLEVHDVGRMTTTTFFDKDGKFKEALVHETQITETLTNSVTGETATSVYTNVIHDQHLTTDPATGTIHYMERYSGLNFLARSPRESTLVSAGMVEALVTVTFDENGDLIFTVTGLHETPNLIPAHTLVC